MDKKSPHCGASQRLATAVFNSHPLLYFFKSKRRDMLTFSYWRDNLQDVNQCTCGLLTQQCRNLSPAKQYQQQKRQQKNAPPAQRSVHPGDGIASDLSRDHLNANNAIKGWVSKETSHRQDTGGLHLLCSVMIASVRTLCTGTLIDPHTKGKLGTRPGLICH